MKERPRQGKKPLRLILGPAVVASSLAAALLAGSFSGSALGATALGQIIAGPGSAITTFYTPRVVITKGGSALFRNFDGAPHNVTSTAGLFRSVTIGLGGHAAVVGVSALRPGTYAFICTIHLNMKGSLTVIA